MLEPERGQPKTSGDIGGPSRGRWWHFAAAGLIGFAGTVLASASSRDASLPHAETSQTPYRDLATFGDAFHLVRALAVDVPAPGPLIDAAITGMVSSLDPYSQYLTAAEFRKLDEQDTGSYAGIGVEIGEGGTIRSTLPEAPAAQAGLAPGTVIESVDGIAVKGLDRDQIVEKLRGEPGSKVKLKVAGPKGGAPAETILIREWLPLHPVRMQAMDGFVYVGIDHFDEFTLGRLFRAVARLKAVIAPDRLKGLVLDLRGNPGGLVVQAIAVAGAFLGHGEIVRLIGRGAGNVERFALDKSRADLIEGRPAVVLVNSGTASAAEIVAAALQDHRRAVVVGTKTYGKGAIQTTYAHRDGRGLRLTTAWAVSPAGRRIQGNGIEPDRIVPRESGAQAPKDSETPFRSMTMTGGGSLQEGIVTDATLDPSRDPQLEAGLQYLDAVTAGQGRLR